MEWWVRFKQFLECLKWPNIFLLFQFPNFCSSMKSCNFSGLLSLPSSYHACCSPLGNTLISAIDFGKTRFKWWFECTYIWKLNTECFFFLLIGILWIYYTWYRNTFHLAWYNCFQKSSIMFCWKIFFLCNQCWICDIKRQAAMLLSIIFEKSWIKIWIPYKPQQHRLCMFAF